MFPNTGVNGNSDGRRSTLAMMINYNSIFTDEPLQYLSSLKEFLLEQQSKRDGGTAAELIAEIDRELSKRAKLSPDH